MCEGLVKWKSEWTNVGKKYVGFFTIKIMMLSIRSKIY